MRRWIIIVMVVAAVALIATGGFFIRQSQNNQPKIRTLTVEPQKVTLDVTFTGRLEPKLTSDISFELPGTVTGVLVQEGEVVAARQPLAHIDTSSVTLELAQARATTASSQEIKKLAVAQAEEDVRYTKELNEKTINKRRQAVRDAKREVDQAKQVHIQRAQESGDTAAATEATIATLRAVETVYHAAQQALVETLASVAQDTAAAEAAVTTARSNLSTINQLKAAQALVANEVTKHTLVAPFAGTITALVRQVGETALAGQTVVTVATTDQLEVVASATETEAIKLAIGMPATINFDAVSPRESWTATVTHLSPAATVIEGISTYTIKLTLSEAAQNLKPGLTATITVHAATAENVLAIPRRAITTRDRQEYVSVMAPDGTISEKLITTGLTGSDGTVAVLNGLAAGERVVINPAQLTDE